jgi:hypothetical protein
MPPSEPVMCGRIECSRAATRVVFWPEALSHRGDVSMRAEEQPLCDEHYGEAADLIMRKGYQSMSIVEYAATRPSRTPTQEVATDDSTVRLETGDFAGDDCDV